MTHDITSIAGDPEFFMYESEDGKVHLQVKYDNETIWVSQKKMSELFGVNENNITYHLGEIYSSHELEESGTTQIFGVVQLEGSREVKREIKHYNLDVILSVGYRVNSKEATHFRIWASSILKEYIIKGFAMNDEKLADPSKNDYFEELLSRIRSIRASERYFYQKITDIFATSVDYKRDDFDAKKMKQDFFASVQNKFHYAIHHHTAPEIIYERVDGTKQNMGMSHFKGDYPTLDEAKVGKNYLSEQELKQLELLVDQYLSFAELQAMNRKEMKMLDWIAKLHDFLHLNDKDILPNAGKISRPKADKKVEQEYKIFMKNYMSDFDRFALETAKKAKSIKKAN